MRFLNFVCSLVIWAKFVCSDQQVLISFQEQELTPSNAYSQALSLLQPFKLEIKEFESLNYEKIIIGEDISSNPPIPLYSMDNDSPEWGSKDFSKLHEDQISAIALLESAAEVNHPPSIQLLAEIAMFGNFSMPTNGSKSLKYYEKLARVTKGNANSHYMLGFIYATGIFGEVERNQAKSLIHYQASHELGDLRATMVLAYRYYKGISVERNCLLSLYYYSAIAQKSMEYILQGPIGGPNIDTYSVRISDFQGGLYGHDASEQASSMTRAGNNHIYDRNIFNEINIDPENHRSVRLYYEANAYYRADYFHKRDYERAFAIAYECSTEGDNIIKWSTDSVIDQIFVSRCCSLLGHMYLRGEGTQQNYTEALKWHSKAADFAPKPPFQVDLGLIYEYGLGLEAPNIAKAKLYYELSKDTSVKAKFHLARLLLNEGKLMKGFELMQLAAYEGSEEALYHLATLYERGVGGKKSCEDNVAAYKAFVERIEPVVSVLEWSFKEYFCGASKRLALIGYAMAAEQGYEVAQISAGYLLYPPLSLSQGLPKMSKERYEAAITYYSRSSNQYNIDSTVFTGDLYFYGVLSPETGNMSENTSPDYKKAFHYYQEASNKHSRQGSFNLGYMYEQGLGVPKDYHLAKRYYDLALLGKSSDTYLAVNLALMKLKVKMFWDRLIGGIGVEDEALERNEKLRTWSDWKDLYNRIKKTNRLFLMDDIQENIPLQQLINEGEEPEEFYDIVDSGEFDLLVLLFILVSFLTLIFLRRTRARARRRREAARNGNADQNDDLDGGGPPNVQFNFMIIPL